MMKLQSRLRQKEEGLRNINRGDGHGRSITQRTYSVYRARLYSSSRFILLLLVNDAIEEVCNEMFPYGFSSDEEKEKGKNLAIKRYGSVIRKIAQYHYDKQGKEGLVGFSESGASVSYDSAGTPTSYLRSVIPVSLIT